MHWGGKVRKMQKLVKEYLDELDKRQKKNRKIHIAVLLLVIMVVGSVAGVLTQYGVAMTGKAKCGLEEHTHNEKCYETVLICKTAEEEGHTHTAECSYPEELICGKEESEGHTHSAECSYPEELICGQEESEEHEHTPECYQVPEGYACGLEESEGHTHTAECYQAPEGYACGLEEGEGHVHTEECCRRELVCGREEHTHTDACYTDESADVEDASVWDAQYAAVEWKGIWGEDLAAAAQMQLGYQESADNYIIAADGIHKGYTRYGHFMGDAYIDWDGAFVNFCIYYAGLSASNLFPIEADTAKWCEEFGKIREGNSAYLTASRNYIPQTGDLIFFQREGEETGNQMGIVSAYDMETATVRVVEGNSGNEVRENAYSMGESRIVSYLKISELENDFKAPEGGETETAETEDALEEEQKETPKGRTMTVNGPDYRVTVSFPAEAEIPAEAVLEVKEIEPGSDAYQEYYSQSLKAVDAEEISFARFFDVTFLVDGEEIEPSAPVDVTISYADHIDIEEDASGSAVHFSKDGTEVLDAGMDAEEHSFTFTQSSFSVVGTIVAKGTGAYYYKGGVPEDLDGKTFLLETIRDGAHIFLTGNAELNSQGIQGLAGSRIEDLTFVQEPEETNLWTFHKIEETIYQIQNAASGKYLNIDGSNVALEEEACELTVETDSEWITIRRGRYFLDADDSGSVAAKEKKNDNELESWNKFRLFGVGREYHLTAEGEDYRITLDVTAPEGMLDNTEFTAEEITGEAAEIYSRKAQEALNFKEVGFQRFFHLEFDKEVPEELIQISSVTIQYKDNAEGFDINGAGGVVQFQGNHDLVLSNDHMEDTGDAGMAMQSDEIQEEVLSAEIHGEDNAVSADISTLADVGTVWEATTGEFYYQQYTESVDDLDGQDFLITCLHGRGLVMGATETNLTSGTAGLNGVRFAGGNLVNRSESMVLWHFEKQADGTFYISQKTDEESEERCIQIPDNGTIRIGAAQGLTVTCMDGKIAIRGARDYINSYSGGAQGGFAGWSGLDIGSKLTLYKKIDADVSLEFTMESADLQGNPITEQTSPKIPKQKHITIEGKNPWINFENNHPWPGLSELTGTELKYGFSRVQIVYANSENIKMVQEVDQLYFSGSDDDYDFIFYNNESYVGTFKQNEVKIQNGYRGICRLTPLDVEPTISTKDKIRMRMIDYPGIQFTGWGWTKDNKGVKQGILKPYLEANSYPSFAYEAGTDTGQGQTAAMRKFDSGFPELYGTETLQDYFAAATDADNLFREDKYINEGYYEYNSTENGASYNTETGKFTVYKQLTTTVNGTEALAGKGQFLPYNTFDTSRNISVGRNLYTAQGAPLSPDHERYGENLYLPDQAVNYNFGMELSTEFYQMQNGKVGAVPMRYEFSGDDDLWVYIDGVLVLDMGGSHDARSGYIDFSTGEVFVQGVETTSLYELFENACEAAAQGASREIIDDLNDKLAPSNWKTVNSNKIFADYTKHDFKMWYMEREMGASNLEVRFNLPVIPPGEVQVEKRLSNTVQGEYTNEKFDFQIYLQPLADDWTSGTDEDYKEVNESEYKLLNQALYGEGRTDVKAYVIQSNGSRESVELPADGIFHLYPGERLALEGLKKNRKYYVRELNMDYNKYSGINLDQIVLDENGEEKAETKRVELEPGTDYADTDTRVVGERVYILINNECSEKNRNALIIKKELVYGDSGGDTYDFRVWLEGRDGELKLYEGNYYLNVNPNEIDDDAEMRRTQEPGIISGISPDDTVVIKDILAGTGFLVEEVDPGPRYDKPAYDLEYQQRETNSPSAAPDEAPGETEDESPSRAAAVNQQTKMGTMQLGMDAKVTVKNRRLDECTWKIIKKSEAKSGSFLEAVFELVSTETGGKTYYGKSSRDDGVITWYRERDCTPPQQIQIGDLEIGTYRLTEIEASPGYSLSADIWNVTIEEGYRVKIAGQEPIVNELSGTNGIKIEESVYTFYNTPVYELPDAGGRGIYWYSIGGMLFMIAGALILYKNKCRKEMGS